MNFLVAGTQEWRLTEDQIERWRAQFPSLDVEGELLKAQAWCEANAARRKTVRGMPRFLVNWLLRSEVDRIQRVRHDDRTRRLLAGATASLWECPHQPRCPHRVACAIVSARKVS